MPKAAESIDQGRNTGPLGTGPYTVKQGECFLSTAHQHGFKWETLWNLHANAKLRAARKDPGLLLPGDRITIPDRETREESCNTDARHQFVTNMQLVKLRLVIEYEDIPVGNADYILFVDGKAFNGTTDEDGLLEVSIPPHVSQGRLEINNLSFTLHLGGLDPSSEDIGIQQRLANLDFYRGALDGQIGPVTREAIANFQSRTGLEPTGELDDTTCQMLLHRHDEMHERLPSVLEPGRGRSNG